MTNDVCLHLDLGLAGVTATVTDVDGRVLAVAVAACETLILQPGWVEQRTEERWRACIDVIAAAGREVTLSGVNRITLGGELRGAVFLDGEMEVIRPAILSTDGRWGAGFGSVVQWLRGNQTIAFKRLQHLLTPRSYLRYRLTGELAIDADDAPSTGLFDVGSGGWSGVLCENGEINVDLLPTISTRTPCPLLDAMAVEFGLQVGISVESAV